jgi:hypothetical protein
MTLKAGDSGIQHSYPNEAVYFIRDGNIRITMENGEGMEAETPDGHVMCHEPWTHKVSDIGLTDIRTILYETQ